jgi:hypothetical protein
MAGSQRTPRAPRSTRSTSVTRRGGGYAIKVKTTERDHGWRALMKLLKDMGHEQTRVVVGVTGTKAAAIHPRSKGQLTVVDVAIQNEFGSAGGKIPERSFIRSTTDANVTKYKNGIRRAFRDMLEAAIAHGEVDPKKAKGLERLGLQVTGDIKRAISGGIPPPNAPATIARKGSDTPLIDTDRLRQSISHEVRRGKR